MKLVDDLRAFAQMRENQFPNLPKIKINFDANFCKNDFSKIYTADKVKARYTIDIFRGQELLYHRSNQYQTFYKFDTKERSQFEERVKMELILMMFKI